jgi:hypothetical protein
MKTAELTGAALDWAVAIAEGNFFWDDDRLCHVTEHGQDFEPSTDWAQGGPIIEREGIALYLYGDAEWNAHAGRKESIGPTPLIAAMRCYVASKLGDEVEIPTELKGA